VPLLNESEELLGALTVSGLLSRFSTDQIKVFRKVLLDAATALRPRLPERHVLDEVKSR
jgi:DNA-binding IclR family transcriptional regulator